MAVNAAQITEGHYQGSAEVIIECDEADGTDIVVFKYVNGVATQVGTAPLGNDTGLGSGHARIPLSVNIAIGNTLVAYVEEQYNQGGDPQTVYELVNGQYKTGWRNPSVVYYGNDSEISYAEYTQETGQEIADVYDPQSTINNTVNRCNDPQKLFADATATITYTTDDLGAGVVNVAIVTIGGFNNALGAPRLKWDGGAFEQVYQKTFVESDNGAHEVVVYPENQLYDNKAIPFTINVAAGTPTPSTGDINMPSYEINPTNRNLSLIAYSDYQLESRAIGLGDGVHGTSAWVAMTGFTGGKWQQPIPFQNVPNGNYDIEYRVQGETDVVQGIAKINF